MLLSCAGLAGDPVGVKRRRSLALGGMGGAVTWFLICVPFSLTGCTDSRGEINHPTRDNMPTDGSPVIRSEGIPSGLSAELLDDWITMRDALLQEVVIIVSLGQLGTDDAHDVFGLEIDVALDETNRMFVLDRRNHVVKMFDPDGSYRGSVGRAGPGPGEFRDPGALEVMSDGRIVVSDRGNLIKVFSPAANGYVHSETHRVEIVPERACATSGRFFVSGWRGADETIIHEVPVSGQPGASRSFGHGYSADSWIVKDALSDGPIACLGEPLRVVFAFEQIPVVKAYSADGHSVLWTATLDGYMQPPLTELRSGGLGISGKVARDIVVSLTPVSSLHVLLQTMRIPPSEPGRVIEANETETRSYLIDAQTGQGALISDSLPLVAVAGADHYVAMWFLPFPRLELRKWNSPFWKTSFRHG